MEVPPRDACVDPKFQPRWPALPRASTSSRLKVWSTRRFQKFRVLKSATASRCTISHYACSLCRRRPTGPPTVENASSASVPRPGSIRASPLTLSATGRTFASQNANPGRRDRSDRRVAEVQLFPTITPIGGISPSYVHTSSAHGGRRPGSFGPALSLPIFDGGTLRANVKIAESTSREQYIAWKLAVLNGVEQVENFPSAVSRDAQTISRCARR